MKKLNFWVFGIEDEMIDLKAGLAETLKIYDLFYDQENYWEYMTGQSKQYDAEVTYPGQTKV